MRYKPQLDQLRAFLNQEIDPQKRIDEILKMQYHFIELGDNGKEFDDLNRKYDKVIEDARFKLSLLNKTTEHKKIEIPKISKLWNNAHEKTESIHKFYYSILNQSKYKTFLVPIQDVYVLPEISNRIDTVISENQFDDNVRLETHFNNYVIGFKKGYFEFLEDYPSSAISFKEDIFSAATNLFTADIDYLRTNQNGKLIPENWDVLGERIGRFYCAWCIIIKRQSFFEPLFKTLAQPREEKTPLTFSGLFKHPYNQDLEKFKTILKSLNLIDENCSWREVDQHNNKVNKSDIGKFFNLLYNETTVFQKTDKRNDAICFCKEFGITAYKENEKPNTGRLVTVEQIVKSEYSKDEQTHYLAIIKRWIDKV
ncbi:MAG: hypothetical protein WCH34_16600 [Bacteroidota bacterium]